VSAWLRRQAALLIFFAGAAMLQTYPLVLRMRTHLPGEGLSDNVSFLWNIWWMRAAIASHTSYFFTHVLMAPLGTSLILHTHTALASALGATVLASLHIVEAQNVLILASVALNGMAAAALAFHLTNDRRAAALSGLLFMLAPPLTTRLMGHFNFVWAWTFVFGVLSFIRLIARPGVFRAVTFGIAAALTAYADYYFFVYLAMFGAGWLLTELWTVRVTMQPPRSNLLATVLVALSFTGFAVAATIVLSNGGEFVMAGMRLTARRPQNAMTAAWLMLLSAALVRWRPRLTVQGTPAPARERLVHLAIAATLCLVLLSPILAGVVELLSSGDYVTQGSSLKTSPRGIDLATLVMGPPFHGLLGKQVRAIYDSLDIDPIEQAAWLGVLPLVLAALPIRGSSPNSLFRWKLLAALFFLWSLGPYFSVFGMNTGMLLPQAIARGIPILNNARIPGRALIVVSLALAMIAAFSVASRPALRRPLVLGLLMAGAFIELGAFPLALARLPSFSSLETYLADDPQPGTVLHVPFGVRDGFGERGLLTHEALYLQSAHGRPIAGGFVARLSTTTWSYYQQTEPFNTLLALSSGQMPSELPSCQQTLSGLARASIRYVILDRQAAAPLATRFVDTLPLERVRRDGDKDLFVVRPSAACP